MSDYSELYLPVKNHIVGKTLPACVILHCTGDNESESPVLQKVEVVAGVQM